jgi:CRISPR-associated protein Cmr2
MNQYLFSVSIGPVQDFIAAARRTRDLFFGSAVLSELSKAGALAVFEQPASHLIFPAPESHTQLQPNSSFSVANKLLFLAQSDDPAQLSEQIEQAVRDRWEMIANDVLLKVQKAIHLDLWQDQVSDAIEFYCAWVPCENDSQYTQARTDVERLLAGRKALRDFQPAQGRFGVPKSSLDGARESVLRDVNALPDFIRKQARLKDQEQLDAIGLIKRLGEVGGRREYPSISRIAADGWVRGLSQEAHQQLQQLQELCQRFNRDGLISQLKADQFAAFPLEGAVLYEQRLHNEFREQGESAQALAAPLLDQLRQVYRTARSQPSPYVAVLLADGDKMGVTLSGLTSPEAHQKFSQQLSLFADRDARAIVEQHQGLLVYSGGDDVLAFLPVDTCLAAAKALHDTFGERMRHTAPNPNEAPTLSVGIAIGHSMDPMEDLLDRARTAEKKAKDPDRDGLAVLLQTRSGGEPILLRSQWQAAANDDKPNIGTLDQRLQQWAYLHLNEGLSDKAAYDFRQLASFYKHWENFPHAAAEEDAKRLLKRKRNRHQQALDETTSQLLQGHFKTAQDIDRVAHELIFARHLAQAYQLAGYKPGKENDC